MGSNEPPARSSCRGGSGDKGLTSDSDIHEATRRGASGEGASAAADGALLGAAVGRRVIALVGMMGSGKTSIGKRLATRLGLPFVDSDSEIETAAGMTITEIFDRHGEAYFREGERRVIARLLGEGPCVLATGGGAFMDARTREAITEAGISVWLRADTATLMQRIARRNNRPLLRTPIPPRRLRASSPCANPSTRALTSSWTRASDRMTRWSARSSLLSWRICAFILARGLHRERRGTRALVREGVRTLRPGGGVGAGSALRQSRARRARL